MKHNFVGILLLVLISILHGISSLPALSPELSGGGANNMDQQEIETSGNSKSEKMSDLSDSAFAELFQNLGGGMFDSLPEDS